MRHRGGMITSNGRQRRAPLVTTIARLIRIGILRVEPLPRLCRINIAAMSMLIPVQKAGSAARR
jgi:hypothetical protein